LIIPTGDIVDPNNPVERPIGGEIFHSALENIYHREFDRALEKMDYLFMNHGIYEEYSAMAIPYLPHLYIELDLCLFSLQEHLYRIDDDILLPNAQRTIAENYTLKSLYRESVYAWERAIEDTNCHEDQLLFTLYQAVNHFNIVANYTDDCDDDRDLPDISRYQPTTVEELLQVNESIMQELESFRNAKKNPSGAILSDEYVPEIVELSISQFPNPFNPFTTIAFSLPNASNVEINVYNLRGQLVRRLVNEFFDSGHHSVVWDSTDDFGRTQGSGIYFYRFVAEEGNDVITGRMVLLK
jgi:hypothetical protein